LKVRENANAVKEKLIQFICRVMQKENEYVDQFAGHEIFKRTNNMDTAAYIRSMPKRIK
jgi:hypothetical protein